MKKEKNDLQWYLKELREMKKTIVESYNAGLDCGKNGATLANCHFSFFATKELAKAHANGVKEGEKL